MSFVNPLHIPKRHNYFKDTYMLTPKYKVHDKVWISSENQREYGIEGFVTKVGLGEVEIRMQDNNIQWFCNHWITKIKGKNDE